MPQFFIAILPFGAVRSGDKSVLVEGDEMTGFVDDRLSSVFF